MKRLLYAFIAAFALVASVGGQVSTPIQTGYVVVTPLQGGGVGLNVSETFGQRVDGALFQSSVLPSPLITETAVFSNSDPASGVDTGVAMVNPNDGAATVTLTLRNDQGATIGVRTITIPAHQQVSRFVTELMSGVPELAGPNAGLLFISSDIRIGVLGLTFVGPSFTSLPVASQLGTNLAVTDTTIQAFGPAAPITSPQTFTFNTASTFTSTPVSLTPLTSPVTSPTNPVVSAPIAPITPIPPIPISPITGTSAALVTSTGTVSPATITVATGGAAVAAFPATSIASQVGAVLLPQVAAGGGWSSQIVLANTSAVPQVVRVDFFTSAGGPFQLPTGSSLSSVVIPAGGVVTLSTNP